MQLELIPRETYATFCQLYWLHRVHRFIPGSLPLAAFSCMHIIGLRSTFPVWIIGIAARIRMVRKTIPDDFIEMRRQYRVALSEHGTLLQLTDWRYATKNWDSNAYVVSLQNALDLQDDRIPSSKRAQIAAELEAIDTREPGFQRQLCETLSKHVLPFDWADFLIRRISMTYHICMNPLPPPVTDIRLCVQNAISKLQRCRPALKYAFLRFCVHSLPTQMRLHDSSSAVCPICGDTFADISHVVSCRDLLQVASHSAAKHMFDGGPKFVSGLRDQLCSGLYMINDTPCDRPAQVLVARALSLTRLCLRRS